MIDAIREALASDERVAFAMLFGSHAQGRAHAGSDVDIALETTVELDPREVGALIGALEDACGAPVDLLLLDRAPPAIAYRVFADGQPILIRDRAAWVRRRHRAVLDYLDFRPMEQRFVRAALAAARGR